MALSHLNLKAGCGLAELEAIRTIGVGERTGVFRWLSDLNTPAAPSRNRSLFRFSKPVLQSPECADCLSDEERQAFIDYIARKPEAGDLIQGTGGARKVRWARDGGGKSGGGRTIYYYHDQDVPLILLTVYPKSVKDNLTPGEKVAIKTAIGIIQAKIRTKRAAR